MVAFVGLDPSTGVARYTFGQLFLWDGIDVVTAVIAIFAVPEMIWLGVKRTRLELPGGAARYRISEVLHGIADCLRHWWLTIRTSIIGAFVGVIPGLGGDAASWLCYGHAVQSSKTPERFGKGAVEGVIAPETANNSKEGGSLLPTVFFGVPGSSGMAVMLGAFVALGIKPGPSLVMGGMDIVWSMIWALVLANIICVLMLLAVAPWLSVLAKMRTSLLIPFVLVLAMLGCYLGAGAWQNLVLLVVLGGLGYMMKRHKWPRPPSSLASCSGRLRRNSLNKAMALWGPAFVLRPLSLVLIALIVASVGVYLSRLRQPRMSYDV